MLPFLFLQVVKPQVTKHTLGPDVADSVREVVAQLRILTWSRTPLIRINWDCEPSGYAENPDNWIFLWKYATLAVRSGKKYHTNGCFRLNIYVHIKTLTRNSLYAFDNWLENLSHKKM